MATTVLNIQTKAYPSISNRIRTSVYLQSDPQAFVASEIDSNIGHPSRIWTFPGLPRNNYGVLIDEINGSNVAINNLGDFYTVPSTLEGAVYRPDEQVTVGLTPNLVDGFDKFTFDGTNDSPDWRGWNVWLTEIGGRGVMIEGVDFNYDIDFGEVALIQLGDAFASGTTYHAHFDPIQNPAGNSYPTVRDFKINLVDADITLDSTYFGDRLLVEPAADYVEITLPDIVTVVQGRMMDVEVSGSSLKCVKFLTQGGTTINFLRGNLYANTNECFSIYKYIRSVTPLVLEWRVCNAEGHFKTLGRIVDEDFTQTDVYNSKLLDGSIESIFKFARHYNDFVLNLPVVQRCNFDDWNTGNNKYLYSLANSANPSNANKFHFPDRRGLYKRANNTGKAGDYQADSVGPVIFNVPLTKGYAYTGAPNNSIFGNGNSNPQVQNILISLNSGGETKPKSFLTNQFTLV